MSAALPPVLAAVPARRVIDGLAGRCALENCAPDYLRNLLIQEAVYASHATGRRMVLADFVPPTEAAPPVFTPATNDSTFNHPKETL